ncbi:TRM11 family SAM-dependent methyltransferase [Paracoccus shanxieyensis]|uniref:RNA methylase n=1 Tax=Paracoccus shanxieyensis TaxID=2675752 RepID=A0A6L6J6K9_9RHOB|nr:DNA methyltransferase [Paracoccus shanxieyensis]MTH66294.1 RNA methylase [Paracoccus shanxieyensis]MTH89097.1 RNA methylase [Paracoccus shanxieyensis]
MRLRWHDYKYYPYEKELASREVTSLIGPPEATEMPDGLDLRAATSGSGLKRLTYFKGYENGSDFISTVQAQLEETARNGKNRQATRYSVHGLHEYKGKFNPQVARALLNIFKIEPGQAVLDPFCGSGTTLVECCHMGVNAIGTDINPLAVFLSNAKLLGLSVQPCELQNAHKGISTQLRSSKGKTAPKSSDARREYLLKWFDPEIFDEIEGVRATIVDVAGELSPIFLSVASNLLREYSQQDPRDLRIRRRSSPLPSKTFTSALLDALPQIMDRILAARELIGARAPLGRAILCDASKLTADCSITKFDAAITSPPYAMALPYIDTQRLSLVWLDLLAPDQIHELEASLIGSRELRGNSRRELPQLLAANEAELPDQEYELCVKLENLLGEGDGFRRRAVPALLYRYFASMKANFSSVNTLMKEGAPYALIVGHNHTTIGGMRHDIDTPLHLSRLAESVGWRVEELIPLQTYRRYGYHVSNAVAAETMIILRKE